jgi:hypothetical protein
VDNTYPDDFTLTVLEGDNYTIGGESGSGPTYPDDFSFTTTPSSGAFLGQVTIDDVAAEDNGVDIIAAFEPVAGICVGTGFFVSGGYIYGLNIYGDDTTTPEEDEGMNSGENFVLCVYDESAGEVLCYGSEFDQWSNENGGVMPAYSDWEEVYDFTSSGGGGGTQLFQMKTILVI